MSFLGVLLTIPKMPFELHKTIEKERGGQIKQESANVEIKLPSPIGIDVSSPMAVLSARKSAMMIRLKEKVDFHQTTYAAYNKSALTVRPERFWDYSSSNARLMEDVGILLGDYEKNWEQIKDIVDTHCKQTRELLAEKDAERTKLIEKYEGEKLGLMKRVSELESGSSGELEATKKALADARLQLSGEKMRLNAEKEELAESIKNDYVAKSEYVSEIMKLKELHHTELEGKENERASFEENYNLMNRDLKKKTGEIVLLQAEIKKLSESAEPMKPSLVARTVKANSAPEKAESKGNEATDTFSHTKKTSFAKPAKPPVKKKRKLVKK